MSHNRDLSAAAGQFGFHSSNIGIGSEAPRYALDVYNSNLLVSGPSAGNIILEDRSVGDSSRPFHVVSSDGGKFVINRSNRSASGTTTSSVNSLTLSNGGNLGLSGQTSPASNIHIGDISGGYELKISANAVQFNRSSNSYIDQLHDTGSILFRMTSSNTEAMRITSAGDVLIADTTNSIYDDSTGGGMNLKANGQLVLKKQATSTADPLMWLNDTGQTTNKFILFAQDGNEKASIGLAGNDLRFARDAYNETLRITSDGDLKTGNINISGYSNTHNIDNYSVFLSDNHANTFFGQNLRLDYSGTSGNHQLKVINQHAQLGGAGMLIGGNGSPYANELNFYTVAANQLAGTRVDEDARMTIDTVGRVTKPNQPAFFVYRNQSSWTLAANDVFIFNTAELNVGSHYNTSNGRFTAPITARYVFHFFSIYTGDANSDSIEMYKNSTRMYGGDVHFTNSIGSAWDCVHYSRVIQLSAGDYVHMQTRTGHTFHGNHWGGWSGYMLG